VYVAAVGASQSREHRLDEVHTERRERELVPRRLLIEAIAIKGGFNPEGASRTSRVRIDRANRARMSSCVLLAAHAARRLELAQVGRSLTRVFTRGLNHLHMIG